MFNFTGWSMAPPKAGLSLADDDTGNLIADPNNDDRSHHNQAENGSWAAVSLEPTPKDSTDVESSDDIWDKGITVSPSCLDDSNDEDVSVTWLQEDRISTVDGGSTRHGDSPELIDDEYQEKKCDYNVFPPPHCDDTMAYTILRVFEFDPCLQRMSVIVGNKITGELRVYSKGSPEIIKTLCRPESIPNNWDLEFSSYAEQGLRVLAIADAVVVSSVAALQNLKRADVEADLMFLGFLLFSNLLRPDSADAIHDLQSSGCCVYMATGDGTVTAAAIGFQAGILPSQVEVLVSGVLVDGHLQWRIKPFGSSMRGQQNDAACCFSKNNHSSAFVADSSVRESDSLLQLLEGRCLSKVGLAISGDVLRHMVMAEDGEDAFSLDQFKVDAFYIEERKFTASSCFSCKRNKFLSRHIRDHRPRTMNTLEFVLRYGQIFSRMSPDDKAMLIQQQQQLPNYPIVGMCGDGANDCAALKASDVGISLSAKEASVAAPFNCSRRKSITVVLDVLREGRGALANSIQNFQYVALYAMIQLCSVTILGHFGASLDDWQFLYLDLCLVLPLSYFMSWSQSSRRLPRVLPPRSLLAYSIVASLVGQVVVQVLFQIAAVFVVLPNVGAWFYIPFEVDLEDETNFFGYENTVTFMVANIQTVVTALILAFGTRPWKTVQRNKSFLFVWALFAIIGFALVLNEAPYMMWLRHLLCITSLPLSFRTILLLTISINILVSFVLEQGLVRYLLRGMETREDSKQLSRESLKAPGVDEIVLMS